MKAKDDYKKTNAPGSQIDPAQVFDKTGETREPLELIKSSIELASQTHRPILDSIHALANAVPPLKLIITGIVSIWDIVHALFIDVKSSKISRGGRVGLALSFIGLGVFSIVFPPLAGALLIASAALAVGKEFLNVGMAISRYFSLRYKLVKEVDPSQRKILENNLKESRNKIFENLLSAALAVTSVVGFALLLTPLAPVGLGLLIGTSAIGITSKLGPPLIKKIFGSKKPNYAKLDTQPEKESTDEIEPIERVKPETTAILSQTLSSGNPEEEIKQGIEEAHQKHDSTTEAHPTFHPTKRDEPANVSEDEDKEEPPKPNI